MKAVSDLEGSGLIAETPARCRRRRFGFGGAQRKGRRGGERDET